MRKIKTCIITDPIASMDQTQEEEQEEIKKRFQSYLPKVKLNFYIASGPYEIRDGTELLIYDFGGMIGCSGLLEDNSRRIIQWAQDHPNSLVVVVSRHTWNWWIKTELQELELDELPNLVLDPIAFDDETAFMPDWWKEGLC